MSKTIGEIIATANERARKQRAQFVKELNRINDAAIKDELRHVKAFIRFVPQHQPTR